MLEHVVEHFGQKAFNAVNARTLALDAGGTALFTQPEMVKNQQKLSKDVNLVYNWIWRIEFQGYCSSALFLS